MLRRYGDAAIFARADAGLLMRLLMPLFCCRHAISITLVVFAAFPILRCCYFRRHLPRYLR